MRYLSSFVIRHSFVILISSFVIVTLGWWLASSENKSYRSHATYTSPPPNTTLTDPALVFQKAFWKRPTTEDQILHAERREWQDKGGLSKWQWFISVQPSPAIVDHLITDNAFMLMKGSKFAATDLPAWFPKSSVGMESYGNAASTFFILWDQAHNLLHATDSGSGFRPGAPEPLAPIASSQPAGRLPTTPPPKP